MNSTIEIIHMQTLWEILGFDLKTTLCISTATLIILALGTTIQKQLYSFLKTRNKRLVNRIILPNVLLHNITYPIILCYLLFAIWVQNPSYYITGSPRPTRFHLTRFTPYAPILFFLKKFDLRDSLALRG